MKTSWHIRIFSHYILINQTCFTHIAILSLTLCAFFLRVYRLDAQSYWIDEAWTVYFANLSFSELWHLLQTVEIMPPFYHPSTILWRQIFGDGEFSMRFYSALFGTVTIPLTYQLGKSLGDIRVALVTVLLMTVAPFQIWHSQEARMYSAFTATSLMSMWGFVNLPVVRKEDGKLNHSSIPEERREGAILYLLRVFVQPIIRNPQATIIYIFGTTWAIMVHYHAVVLIGIQGLFLLLTGKRHWRGYLVWGGMLSVILLLLGPWLIFGMSLLQSYQNWVVQPTLGEAFRRSLTAYSVGKIVPAESAIHLSLPFLLAYLIGLIYVTRRRWRDWSGWLMLAYLISFTIAPILAAWIYGELQTTVYLERYLILVHVGYLLTVACGVVGIYDFGLIVGQILKISTFFRVLKSEYLYTLFYLILLLSINLYNLNDYYFNPIYAKANWRGVAEMISTFGQADDAILLTGDGGEHAFNFYYNAHDSRYDSGYDSRYNGKLPVYYPFNLSPHKPGIPRLEGESARKKLADIASAHNRLWFTPYGMYLDPMLEQWLINNSFPAWQSWLGSKRLALYGNPNSPTPRHEVLQYPLTEELTWQAINLPKLPLKANDLLPIRATWRLTQQPTVEYRLSIRLTNEYGDIFAQNDWPPLKEQLEVAQETIESGDSLGTITTTHALWIPVDLPPGGRYALQLVGYDGNTGQGLGEPLIIPEIQIEGATITPSLKQLAIPNRTNLSLGELQIVGYVVPEQIQSGQNMWAWVYFQCITDCQNLAEDQLQLQLGSPLANASSPEHVYQEALTTSLGTVTDWQVGQVRRAVYHVPTSPYLMSKTASLIITLATSNDKTKQQVSLTEVLLND